MAVQNLKTCSVSAMLINSALKHSNLQTKMKYTGYTAPK